MGHRFEFCSGDFGVGTILVARGCWAVLVEGEDFLAMICLHRVVNAASGRGDHRPRFLTPANTTAQLPPTAGGHPVSFREVRQHSCEISNSGKCPRPMSAEVRLAAGHANLVTTSIYLHVAVDDEGEVGRLFGTWGGNDR